MGSKKVKLGDYCEIIKGNIGIQKATAGKFPLVVTAEKRLTHNEFQFDNAAIIIPLVSSTGHGHASINRIHYQEGKFALGNILCAVIIKDITIINPRFLYIYLSYFKDHLLVPLMKGAANVTLSIKKIKEVEIILPPLERQLEIIELENNNDLVDELNIEIQIQKQLLAKLKQVILQEAVQGKLTEGWRKVHPELISGANSAENLLKQIKVEKAQLIKDGKIKKEKPLPPITKEEIPFKIPKGWSWCRLGEVGLLKSGNSYKYEIGTEKDVPYIKVGDMNINGNFEDTLVSSNYLKYTTAMEKDLISVGNIIFPKRGGAIATNKRCNVLTKRILIDSNTMAIKISSSIHFNYFSCWFKTIDLSSFGNEAVIPQINNKDILPIKFPLPPQEEQKEIAKKVETLMQKCQALETEIKQSETNAQMLMQAVLKEAFES